MNHKMEVPCPNCGEPVPWNEGSVWRPFCSKRCRLVDLGAWFNEERAIASETGPAPEPPPED